MSCRRSGGTRGADQTHCSTSKLVDGGALGRRIGPAPRTSRADLSLWLLRLRRTNRLMKAPIQGADHQPKGHPMHVIKIPLLELLPADAAWDSIDQMQAAATQEVLRRAAFLEMPVVLGFEVDSAVVALPKASPEREAESNRLAREAAQVAAHGAGAAACLLWQTALGLNPWNSAAHRDCAMTLVDLGAPAEARVLLEQGLFLDPKDHITRLLLTSLVLEFARAGEQAERLALQVLEDLPDNLFAQHALGLALYQQGQRLQACDLWRKLIASDPRVAFVYPMLAAALHEEGKDREALDILDRMEERARMQDARCARSFLRARVLRSRIEAAARRRAGAEGESSFDG